MWQKALEEIYSGDLGGAEQTCRQGIEEGSTDQLRLRSIWAPVLVEQGRLDEALAQVRLVRQSPRQGVAGEEQISPVVLSVLCTEVRISRLTGDWDQALERAEWIAYHAADLGQALRASTLAQRGDPAWMEEESARSQHLVPPIFEEQTDQDPWQAAWHLWGMVWTRVMVARSQRVSASKNRQPPVDLLQPVLVYLMNRMGLAERGGLVHRLIELSIWQSLAMDSLGDRLRALVALERAVRLALPGRYHSVFREAGPALQFLLEAFRAEAARKGGPAARLRGRSAGRSPDQALLAYVDDLLRLFKEEDAANAGLVAAEVGSIQPGPVSSRVSGPGLGTLPTQREVEILKLLAQGLTYDDIAEALIISLPTVRWHIHGLYRKLGVSSRARAVARGKELDWL